MMPRSVWLLLVVSLMLVSCGSGYSSSNNNASGEGGSAGGGNSGGNSAQDVDGVFSAVASNGYTFTTIILPNEKLYGIYGTISGNQLLLDGLITGQGTTNGTSYNASVTDFSFTGTVSSGTFSASGFSGASMDGSLAESGNVTTFTAASDLGSVWDYGTTFQTPASPSAISGSWTGTLLDGMTTTVTISSNGSLTGSSSGCLFTGTVVPDSSKDNFYDVSLTFGGSPCSFSNQTANGIAVEYLLSDGVTNQFLAAVTIGNSGGTVFAAER
ncbi:MAG: hypothetical protein ABSA57_20500 [Candidatus Acidiferrales bacterium]